MVYIRVLDSSKQEPVVTADVHTPSIVSRKWMQKVDAVNVRMRSILATLLLISHNAEYVRPNPALALLQVAWEQVMPGSVKNRVKKIQKELEDIKTSIVKSEFAVIYGDDIKTLEYFSGQIHKLQRR